MMDFIRKNAASWMMKLILGAIALVFIFWGVGSFRSQRLETAAKVNGEKILLTDYNREYNRVLERYQQMFGGTVPEAIMKGLNIKQQVLDNLINQEIIAQEAEKMGIRVTDQEIQDVILNIDAFKKDGAFDLDLYKQALRNARMVPADFEKQVRQEITIRKVQALLGAGLHATQDEIKERYAYINQEINLAFIKIPSSSCEDSVKVDEKELVAWYEKNKENYRTDPKIKLRYLLFDRKEFEKQVKVTPEEVKGWYEQHKEQFQKPEMRHARHILLKLPQEADESKTKQIQAKAEKILKQLQEGKKSFQEMAKEYSQDPGTAEKGGDLGFFPKGVMVKPFEDAVFSMKEGEVKGPVRTQFGLHIIRLDKIRPAKTASLQEVKDQIEQDLRKQKAGQLMWEAATRAYDSIIEMGGLDLYAKAEKKQTRETGLFSRANPDPAVGNRAETLNAVMALEKGELSSILEVPQGLMVAEAVDKKLPYIPKLNDVRQRAEQDFIREKAVELCREKAEKLVESAKKEGLIKAAEKAGLAVEETGLFKRGDSKAGGKLPAQAVAKARSLMLQKGKNLVGEPVQIGNTFYVVGLKQVKDAPADGLKSQKDSLKQKILAEKRQTVFMDWLNDARNRAEIEVKRGL